MATTTMRLRCWEISAGIPMDDGRLADCSQPEVIGEDQYHPTREDAEQYAQDCRDLLPSMDLDAGIVYDAHEVVLYGSDALAVAARWTDDQRAAAGWCRCECGDLTGERCVWIGPLSETVRVTYLPEQHRETARACGSDYGMRSTVRVHHECAAMLCEHDEAAREEA